MTHNILLWIISRIGEYSRIYTPGNTIETPDHDTIFIGLDEIFVQQNPPDGMHKFALAVGEKVVIVLFG